MPREPHAEPSEGRPGHSDCTVAALELDEASRTLAVIFLDGTRLEMAPDAPEARGLAPGLRVDPLQKARLESAAERKVIARRVFALLDRRARTRFELHQRLVAEGCAAAQVDAVLDRCVEQGLVDDFAFARSWVRAQSRRRGVGSRWLRGRLRELGVDEAQIGEAIAELRDETTEVEAAVRALRGRRLDLESESHRRRALRFLQSRGFDAPVAFEALGRLRRAARAAD